ncbi:hypothetical protein HY469_00700, partial [Candidatus Roizmanbacteria bacterium]|nr:hypothetical protein [Candidatus Roizmanbacteria bacterium]
TKSNGYLMYIEGLPTVKLNTILTHSSGSKAIVTSLGKSSLQALMLDQTKPKPGDEFSVFTEHISIPVGPRVLGRVVNPMGEAIDDKASLMKAGKSALMRDVIIDSSAPGISKRHLVNEQFQTGMTLVDGLVPIGKGQRELIIGEPRSGVSSFIVDCIANQKNTNTICIYTAIGKSELEIKQYASSLESIGATSYSLLVAAPSSSPAPLIMLAPQTGLTIAEQFAEDGYNVLVILDDMGLHAKYVREISLIAEQVPGRESYPGNIFNQHARLIERAGNFNLGNSGKSVSITLLPIIDVISESITSYITTNLMAMTDGHILFSSELSAAGSYPAIDQARSVTRVGRQTQHPLLRALSDRIRALLARYEEVRSYSRFGSELTQNTLATLNQSEIILELLRQEDHDYRDLPVQITLLALPFTRFLALKDASFVKRNKKIILTALREDASFRQLYQSLNMALDLFIQQVDQRSDILNKLCQ